MASTRFGYLDDFTQKNTNVGIGTSSPQDKMEVIGETRSQDLKVAGIATLTSPHGFIEKRTGYVENVNITSGDSGTLSGEIIVGSGQTMVVGTAATSSQGTVDALKVYDMFQPPSGGTNQRPPGKTGALFYNFDFKTIEFFDGNSWRQVDNTTRRGRGVFAGGRDSGSSNQTKIQFINIASVGDAQNFGDLATARMWAGGASNAIRGLFSSGTPTSNMDYITIASEGNGVTFGTCNQTGGAGSLASSTRALFGGGYSNTTNAIQYVEIMTLGNSVDFGDLRSRSNFEYIAAASNPVRGFFMANGNAGNSQNSDVDVVTIAAKGNSVKFGDLTHKRGQSASFSNSTRAIQACGSDGPSARSTNTIDYITMSSDGTGIDFGDSPNSLSQLKTGAASQTRGCFAGGTTNGSDALNTINFIQIATTGNAQDFGDLSFGRRNGMGGLSDSHGGLGGF